MKESCPFGNEKRRCDPTDCVTPFQRDVNRECNRIDTRASNRVRTNHPDKCWREQRRNEKRESKFSSNKKPNSSQTTPTHLIGLIVTSLRILHSREYILSASRSDILLDPRPSLGAASAVTGTRRYEGAMVTPAANNLAIRCCLVVQFGFPAPRGQTVRKRHGRTNRQTDKPTKGIFPTSFNPGGTRPSRIFSGTTPNNSLCLTTHVQTKTSRACGIHATNATDRLLEEDSIDFICLLPPYSSTAPLLLLHSLPFPSDSFPHFMSGDLLSCHTPSSLCLLIYS